MEGLEARRMLSVYYVSPTGSDSNSGLSQASPWLTVAKVNAATFNPGDEILFQRGGQWEENLSASSSGTAASPIVYGAYGDASLAKPEFVGSNVLSNSAFTLLSGTTYTLDSPLVLNWIYDNHAFTHNADDADSGNTSGASGYISYVEANSETFYYEVANQTLYLNLGGSLSGHVLTAAVRENCVFNNGQSYVTFDDLDVTECAADDGGYAFEALEGNNVTIENCDASMAGKHHFGDIDSTAFLGENLTATQASPDLGYGGASAYVTFSDNLQSRANNTAVWDNIIWTDPNGDYPAIITHGDPGSLSSVIVRDMDSTGYGTGAYLESTQESETIQVIGGVVNDGSIQVYSDNSVVDGVTMTGTNACVEVYGNSDVVQNCLFENIASDPNAGHNGCIQVDSFQGAGGDDDVIRFNTFAFATTGPAIAIVEDNSNTSIYGNIFANPTPIWLDFDNSNGEMSVNYNIYAVTPSFEEGDVLNSSIKTLAQWQGVGYDSNSLVANPNFVNAAAGDYSLQSGSPAIDFYPTTPDASVVAENHDFANSPRPVGSGYDAGAFEYTSSGSTLALVSTNTTDSFYLRLVSASTLGVWENSTTPGTGTPTVSVSTAGLETVSITGGGSVTADFSGGNLPLSGGIYWGSSNNTMVVVGGGGTDNISVSASQFTINSVPVNYYAQGIVFEPAGSAATVNANGGTLMLAPQSGSTAVNINTLNIAAGAIVSLSAPLGISSAQVLVLSGLAITGTGVLDAGSSDLIIHNSNSSQILNWVKQGFADGAWTGTGGINSTAAAAAAGRRSLGAILNTSYSGGILYNTFDGVSVSSTDVIVKYTLPGDANLDGFINGDDYSLTDNGANAGLTGWQAGDFNYDGVVDGNDYTILDAAFNGDSSLADATAQISTPAEQISSPAAADAVVAVATKAAVSHVLVAPVAAVSVASAEVMHSDIDTWIEPPAGGLDYLFAGKNSLAE